MKSPTSYSYLYTALLGSLLILGSQAIFAQSAFEDGFTKEYSYGIGINTNGGLPASIFFKYGKVKNARTNTTFGFEIAGVRHPQEVRVAVERGLPFIRGKANYLFSFRPQIGQDFLIFRKDPTEGVQVSLVLAGGPSIGLIKPYFVQLNNERQRLKDVDFYNFYTVEEFNSKFNESVDAGNIADTERNILGKGSFFNGFDEIKWALGFHAKVGLAFEISAFKGSITGAEAGFNIEAFNKQIPLMGYLGPRNAEITNYQTFAAMYLNFFFGSRK